jgi:hypothetical protein
MIGIKSSKIRLNLFIPFSATAEGHF